MSLTNWDLPLRHRISGKRVYVVAPSCTKNQIALGYAPHGPTEEMVMKNGMRSAHSKFLDLENCSEASFATTPMRAASRKRHKEIHQANVAKLAKQQREIDSAAMEDNPIWGSF